MPYPAALAGTVAAARPCRCGHPKIRHANRGTGRCSAVVRTRPQLVDGPAHTTLTPCKCSGFIDKRQD